ncbi:BTB/POZ domain protein [Rhizoctonia solani 123E]|uniref:BTB/POZ domain protein n=1 Tax=Rhizoctonia solani 123E TaxID=1423351 RepID=A0A074RKJ2_9AGAM|nr:BTB/POZ domain protein [Rhizoctonia solani 123E]
MKSSASTCSLPFSDESISDISSPVIVATNPEPKTDAPLECKGLNLFEPGDGDIQITVNGTSFESHKYLIKRFQGLKSLLDTQTLDINIQCDDISAEDFCEMFKVLYASIVTGPFVFTPRTLISTLRVATAYKHHEMRDYCIQYLERLELDAVNRIELAQELHIPDWEKPAYHELGMREKPISKEEAKTIGLEAFVIIAEMREKEQRRRGKEIDAMDVEQVRQSPVSASKVSVQDDTISDGSQKAFAAPLSGDTSEGNATVARPDHGVYIQLQVNILTAQLELTRI